jgi:hypothetical protein
MNKVLWVNQGRTLDNLRFSGNKSLLEENDLMGKTFADPFARNFHVGGNSPFSVTAAGHTSICFSSQWESLAEKFNRFA